MSLTGRVARRLTNYQDVDSVGATFRRRRIGPLLQMIGSIAARKGNVSIIDVGGTAEYWKIVPVQVLESNDVRITLANIHAHCTPSANPRFTHARADGCDLSSVSDNQFDIAHSNSVIEHVGDWQRMVRFAAEIRRVAPNYFVQTPNYWFPIEPHCMTPFFHWLPRPLRVKIVMRFSLGHWRRADDVDDAVDIVESARLLDRRMMAALFPDANLIVERALTLPKSIIAVRARS